MSSQNNVNTADLDREFRSLIHGMIGQYDPERGIGYMTTSIYDTAWVACVQRPDGQQLFPEALSNILGTQTAEGAWSEGDDPHSRVLSSLAALFALKHCQQTWNLAQLEDRIAKAQNQLQTWLRGLEHIENGGVGFEVIVPCLLNLLENEGILLEFPDKENLLKLKSLKLAKIPKEILYNARTPLLHSLEAFFDDPEIEYDRFAKHKINGSLMASPSSTAAYLMRSSIWDNEAEAYLRFVFHHGGGNGTGLFPSAFPSTIFETNWVLSTTLAAGFDFGTVDDVSRQNMTKIYQQSGASDGQCVPFAPGLEPDLDDTAKMSITASFMGLPQISNSMITQFETPTHMETFKLERNPSFSANCNALLAMLVDSAEQIVKSRGTIETVTRFLCNTWAATSSLPADKWNVSPYYAPMLMAEAFVQLLEVSGNVDTPLGPADLLEQHVTRALIQYAIRTLRSQHQNGSWGIHGPREETSYAIIGLVTVSRVPCLRPLSSEIDQAVEKGCHFLQASRSCQGPERLWVEKVLYGSPVLSAAYVLAAKKLSLQLGSKRSETDSFLKPMTPGDNKERSKDYQILMLLQKLPMLKDCPSWIVKASVIEAQTFIPFLKSIRQRVFTREGFTDDKYFQWIPIIWTLANNSLGGSMASATMVDMMAISIINFQVDEFMESVVASVTDEQQTNMSIWLARKSQAEARKTLQETSDHLADSHGPYGYPHPKNGEQRHLLEAKLVAPLNAFFEYIATNAAVQRASQNDRDKLFDEISKFLDAHLQQNKDNAELRRQRTKGETDADGTSRLPVYRCSDGGFQSWVRWTGANHTSCPYSFAYATCISSRGGKDFFPTFQHKYMAEDICRHLATMCRLYNDAGSIQRDQDEYNLNSADFAELYSDLPDSLCNSSSSRDRILTLASYERALLDTTYRELEKISSAEVMNMLRIFIRVTDMFGEIYILKDLASRKIVATQASGEHGRNHL